MHDCDFKYNSGAHRENGVLIGFPSPDGDYNRGNRKEVVSIILNF